MVALDFCAQECILEIHEQEFECILQDYNMHRVSAAQLSNEMFKKERPSRRGFMTLVVCCFLAKPSLVRTVSLTTFCFSFPSRIFCDFTVRVLPPPIIPPLLSAHSQRSSWSLCLAYDNFRKTDSCVKKFTSLIARFNIKQWSCLHALVTKGTQRSKWHKMAALDGHPL